MFFNFSVQTWSVLRFVIFLVYQLVFGLWVPEQKKLETVFLCKIRVFCFLSVVDLTQFAVLFHTKCQTCVFSKPFEARELWKLDQNWTWILFTQKLSSWSIIFTEILLTLFIFVDFRRRVGIPTKAKYSTDPTRSPKKPNLNEKDPFLRVSTIFLRSWRCKCASLTRRAQAQLRFHSIFQYFLFVKKTLFQLQSLLVPIVFVFKFPSAIFVQCNPPLFWLAGDGICVLWRHSKIKEN